MGTPVIAFMVRAQADYVHIIAFTSIFSVTVEYDLVCDTKMGEFVTTIIDPSDWFAHLPIANFIVYYHVNQMMIFRDRLVFSDFWRNLCKFRIDNNSISLGDKQKNLKKQIRIIFPNSTYISDFLDFAATLSDDTAGQALMNQHTQVNFTVRTLY